MKRIIGIVLIFSMLSFGISPAKAADDMSELCETIVYAAQLEFSMDENTAAEDILYNFILNPYNEPLFESYYRTEEKYDYDWSDEYVSSLLDKNRPYVTVYDTAVTDVILKKFFNVSEDRMSGIYNDSEIHKIDDSAYAFYHDGAYYVSWEGGYGGPYNDVTSSEIVQDFGGGKYGVHFSCEWLFYGTVFDMYCIAKKSDDYASNKWQIYAIGTDASIFNAQSGAEDEISVLLDGEKLSFERPPVIIDGRTLVPLRAIFEAMGADVEWDEDTETITSKKGSTEITMLLGSGKMEKNQTNIYLDVPSRIIDDYTMVPARAVAEGMGAKVDWNNDTRTVYIDTTPKINGLIVTADEKYTNYDAGLFREILMNNKLAKTDESYIHTKNEPTYDEFEALIDRLVKQAGEDDVTYFVYSGHGGSDHKNEQAWQLSPGMNNRIAPRYVEDASTPHPDQYAIYMKVLIEEYLNRIPGRVVVVLNSCYSGEINQREFGVNRDKFKILTACSEDEFSTLGSFGSVVIGQVSTSKFLGALFEGLGGFDSGDLIERYILKYNGEVKADYNGDRNVTLSELFRYIDENMDKEYIDNGVKKIAHPTCSDADDETVIYSY